MRRRPGLGCGIQCREHSRIVPVEIKLPIFVLALFPVRRLRLLIPILLQGQGIIQVRINDTLQQVLYRWDLAELRFRENGKETPCVIPCQQPPSRASLNTET